MNKGTPLEGKCIWNDEDKLGDFYCREIAGCGNCGGTGIDGEPNGYGCEGRDEFIESHTHRITSELKDSQILFKKEDIKSAVNWLKEELWNKLKLSKGWHKGDKEDLILRTINKAFEDVMDDRVLPDCWKCGKESDYIHKQATHYR